MNTDLQHPKTKYMLIYEWVISGIQNGTFPYKSKIPSEAEIMKRFSVSRQTVRNAIHRLVDNGYINSVRGSGNYVLRKVYRKSNVIGVMFTVISGYICADIFDGLESVLARHGYSIQLELSHYSVENEAKFIKKMMKSNVAGLVLEPTKSGFPTPNAKLFQKLDDANIPYVFVNSCYSNVKSNAVVWNDEKVAFHLTRHLIKAGHPNIACFFRFDEMQGIQRYMGFVNALRDCGLEVQENNVCWYSINDENNFVARNESCIDFVLNNAIQSCSAIICYNDIIAGSIINKLRNQNISVPDQINIVSFDNSNLVQYFGIEGFLSFNHPKAKLGEAAAKMLLHCIQDHPEEKTTITVTSK